MRNMTKEEALEEGMGTRSTETRPLWAVAAEERDPKTGVWGLIIRYNHSTCEAEARTTYLNARQGMACRIVSVGLAVGFKVDDDRGILLSA
jgi:hypothetical protein